MIERDEYAVRLLDLPTDVGGFVTESPDGFLNIYINARHSRDQQRRSLRHELRHADADDLHSTDPVSTIEARADAADATPFPQLVKARDLQKPSPLGVRSHALGRKVAAPSALTDEVPGPHVAAAFKAATVPVSDPVTPHQARTIMHALSDLDRFLFRDEYDY